jgi:transposase-like protein
MSDRWPKAAALLADAEDDILAYMQFPQKHWTRIHSTNPLERVNCEIRRRNDVAGIFPEDPSAIRLLGALLMELDDECKDGRSNFSPESIRTPPDPEPALVAEPGPLRLAPIR